MERRFSADVLVIGGGTAGFGAALGAARAGARVRLIEGLKSEGKFARAELMERLAA